MAQKTLIIVPVNNQAQLIKKNLPALENLDVDVLLVDDGSTDDSYDIIKSRKRIKSIKLEQSLGIGAAIINGYEYARDMEYEVMIILDISNDKIGQEIALLMENIDYGYDIVNSSRILENFDHSQIPQPAVDMTSEILGPIREITDYDLTDPLSGTKAIRVDALKNMELTEYDHGLFLQLWIQAHYFGLTVLEVPSLQGSGFGSELQLYEDPVGAFLSLIETEKFLYNKKSMN